MYLIRLDDASEYMDVEKWNRIEKLLDRYSIKPIVGVIPNNQDKELVNSYSFDPEFWYKAKSWQEKKWAIALHGYTHVYSTSKGGINPINFQSEFAGVPLEEQKRKISKGIKVFRNYGIETKIFFAPSHTFDHNTLRALKLTSHIRIISDTIANDIYKRKEFHFIPQQSGSVRRLPFKLTTFCYHPNNMNEEDFILLENFFEKHKSEFTCFHKLNFADRKATIYDKFLKKAYFSIRSIRNMFR
ncbi:DUF2334 domain-containing protein [Lentibacillus sediminis]|uniref:DUF2334 domain-containing protein n=1 Tax=Lentibacillus sediminis TaxID=1940529 RepID=UPI000C1BECAD|nr:DUF2334 domain-containing protein [Lentibacillus sediminis]